MFPFNFIQDDVDYLLSLYNFTKFNILNINLIKNAQQLHLTANIKPCNSNIDADKFFYNQFSDVGCAYYLDHKFNRMIENKSIEYNFSLIHINARSLSNYLDHLNIYLTSLSHMFSVIAVTETWENFTNESLLIIHGYNSIFKTG